jgi:hypothetical protein
VQSMQKLGDNAFHSTRHIHVGVWIIYAEFSGVVKPCYSNGSEFVPEKCLTGTLDTFGGS